MDGVIVRHETGMNFKAETMSKNIAIEKTIDWNRIKHLLVIGLIGAILILVGDFLAGWGIRDTSLDGIEGLISPYLTISDRRLFWERLVFRLQALATSPSINLSSRIPGNTPSCIGWEFWAF
jgi:hypothetical protein